MWDASGVCAGCPVNRPCDSCGEPYEAVRPSSRFCSSACRQWAHRNPGGVLRLAAAGVDNINTRLAPGAIAPPARPVAVVAPAVFAELLAAGQDRTVLGAVALGLASQIDSAGGLGVAPLAKELRETMNAALLATLPIVDPLDELQARPSHILRHKGPRP